MDSPLIVALDFDSLNSCLTMARQLSPEQCRLKVGKELFTLAGPQLIEQLMRLGFEIFLDLKFHDIPSTTAKAIKVAAGLGVWMVNVHAVGGAAMMRSARAVLDGLEGVRPRLIGVTLLTSWAEQDLAEVGFSANLSQQVMKLATLAKASGLDGVVCSPREVALLKAALGEDFIAVTPGIRPLQSISDDQRRTMTPEQALREGSDYLVVGRPITQAADPVRACETILARVSNS